MVGAGQHPGHMGCDQPYKADGSADGHARADQHRDGDHDLQLDPADGNAHMPGIFFAHGKGVQFPAAGQNPAAAGQQHGAQQSGVAVVAPGQRTHGPEGDGAQFLSRKGDQQADEAGREHGEDHADQNDAVGAQAAVKGIGKPQDYQK